MFLLSQNDENQSENGSKNSKIRLRARPPAEPEKKMLQTKKLRSKSWKTQGFFTFRLPILDGRVHEQVSSVLFFTVFFEGERHDLSKTGVFGRKIASPPGKPVTFYECHPDDHAPAPSVRADFVRFCWRLILLFGLFWSHLCRIVPFGSVCFFSRSPGVWLFKQFVWHIVDLNEPHVDSFAYFGFLVFWRTLRANVVLLPGHVRERMQRCQQEYLNGWCAHVKLHQILSWITEHETGQDDAIRWNPCISCFLQAGFHIKTLSWDEAKRISAKPAAAQVTVI